MHPAFSVIFLTTLIGAGQGLFLALYTSQLYSTLDVLPLPLQDAHEFFGFGSLLALLLLIAGLLASFFHLGRPERAWRSASQWKTSWLSREVIVLPAFMAATALYGMAHYFNFNPLLFTIGNSFLVDLSFFIGAATTVLAFLLFICTGMIYACIKFLQEWASPLTVINYTLLGTASGFTLATVFAAIMKPELVNFYAGWAIIITVSAFITRVISLMRNSRIKFKSSMATAIGIRDSRIQQKSQGFMGGSFNTREYFHGMSQAFMKNIKWVFILLVFIVPVILLSIGFNQPSLGLFAITFIIQYIGLIAERWFFFAQANHPQNLYYQTI